MPLVDGGVREAHEFPFEIPSNDAGSRGRLIVPQFATLVFFRGLDLWTIWGVQLPACLPQA